VRIQPITISRALPFGEMPRKLSSSRDIPGAASRHALDSYAYPAVVGRRQFREARDFMRYGLAIFFAWLR